MRTVWGLMVRFYDWIVYDLLNRDIPPDDWP